MKRTARRTEPATIALIALAFTSGFTMMLVEVTAARLIAPYFGSSVFTWTNVIGAIMAALAAGYYIGGRIADRGIRLSSLAGIALAFGVLSALIPFAALAVAGIVTPAEGTLVSAAPVLIRASLIVSLLVFAPPIFFAALASPCIVRLLSDRHGVGWAAGVNSAVGTAGALCGTFLPTLLLVPSLGSRRTILVGAMVQIAAAVAAFVVAGSHGRGAAAGLVLAVPLLGWPFGNGPLRAVDGLVEERESRYQAVRVVRTEAGVALRLDAEMTGSQSLLPTKGFLTGGQSYYDHLLLLPFLAQKPPGSDLRVLVLGLGAGTLPRQYVHFLGDSYRLSMTGVEVDPAVVNLGRRHLDLDYSEQRGLTVHIGDARTILRGTRDFYDVIVVDAFAQDVFVPFHLTTREFFSLVKRRLAPGGVLGMNVVFRSVPSRFVDRLEATVRDVFGSAWRLRPPGSMNVELLARKDAAIDPLTVGRAVSAFISPSPEWDAARGLLLNGLVAATPIDTTGSPVLTDDHAPVEMLMLRDMRERWQVR